MNQPPIDFNGLDSTVHGPVRLGVLTALQIDGPLDFTTLKKHLQVADGTLGLHLEKLEASGYILATTVLRGRRPKFAISGVAPSPPRRRNPVWHVALASLHADRWCSWTDSWDATEDRALKHRARRATRTAPAPPELVAILRRHLATFPSGVGGRLFVTRAGRAGIPVARVVHRGRKKSDYGRSVAVDINGVSRVCTGCKHVR